MQRTALIPHYRINSGTTPDIRSAIGTALGGAIIDFIQTDSIHICTVLTVMSSQITDGFNWSIHSIYTTPALAATLSNIIDGLSFPSTLRDPRSQEHQSTIIGGLLFPSMHRWKKKRPMISRVQVPPVHPLYLHELLQRGGVMKPKVASKAVPLKKPTSVKQSIKTLMV
jgi:hypothetical protein